MMENDDGICVVCRGTSMVVPYDPRSTTGKPEFAVRENLCRAFSFGRTAKNHFAVRFI
jgi:hypothetical protein